MELSVNSKVQSRIKPLHDFTLVKRVDGEKVSTGGIIIPDNAREKPSEGIVLAIGPGKYEFSELRPLQVKSNDRILFGKYSGTDVSLGDSDYLLLREEEILAVIEEVKEVEEG